ncbi:hypothetical protein BDW22DRAFT_1430698 [Trametopsis cervina]|nr:hypothetical protein BDW22DRAFT_1430698 [Trametopsis cervina]
MSASFSFSIVRVQQLMSMLSTRNDHTQTLFHLPSPPSDSGAASNGTAEDSDCSALSGTLSSDNFQGSISPPSFETIPVFDANTYQVPGAALEALLCELSAGEDLSRNFDRESHASPDPPPTCALEDAGAFLPTVSVNSTTNSDKAAPEPTPVANPAAVLLWHTMADRSVFQAARRIATIDGLEAFSAMLQQNQGIGLVVDTFEVVLDAAGATRRTFVLLHDVLKLLPQLTDLIIQIYRVLPEMFTDLYDILSGVELRALELFKTNLPHRAIIPFLQNFQHRRSLFQLVLEDCGLTNLCPLREVDLTHITDLECPIHCAQRTSTSHLTRLILHNASPSFSASDALLKMPIRSNLTHLTLKFFSSDLDILNSIILFAPRLRKLRLIELVSAARNGRVSARRVWKSVGQVSHALKKLRFLEELMVQSSGELARGDALFSRQEEQLVHGWLTGYSRPWSKPQRAVYHSRLYRISLLYGTSRPGKQVYSTWMKGAPRWERVSYQVGYLKDVVF